jgi:putative nucleotidyltransferase with HDIG domain
METRDPLLDAVLASGVKLPTLSGNLARLHTLAADDNANPNELAQLIGKDPALTGEFIRVANSPVFRTRTPAKSVKAAITFLGRTKSLAIITSNALRSNFTGLSRPEVQHIWAAASGVADGAWRAAQVSRFRHLADLAYLAGLMHDVGIPILIQRFPEYGAHFIGSASIDGAAAAADRALVTDHAAIGAMVARNWKLPAEVVEAITLHHRPTGLDRAEPHGASLAILVAAGHHLHAGGHDPDWPEWAPAAATYLGLDEAKMAELLAGA